MIRMFDFNFKMRCPLKNETHNKTHLLQLTENGDYANMTFFIAEGVSRITSV